MKADSKLRLTIKPDDDVVEHGQRPSARDRVIGKNIRENGDFTIERNVTPQILLE